MVAVRMAPRAFTALVLILALTPALASAGIEYQPASTFVTDASIRLVKLGDVDGDHRPDAIVAGDDGGFRPMIQGEGVTFQPGDKVAGPSAYDFELFDLDSDGDLDVALASPSEPGLSLWINDGLAHFTPGPAFFPDTTSAGSMHVRSLISCDLDGDGDRELVVGGGDHAGTCVMVFSNTPSGLVITQRIAVTGEPYALAAGDVDGDGDVDVLAAGPYGLLRNVNGTLQVYGSGSLHGSIALGDLDGDGDLDVVQTEGTGFSSRLNDGDGVFFWGTSVPVWGQTAGLVVADLDGDGRADAATASADLSTATIRHSHGDGTFDEPTMYFSAHSTTLDDAVPGAIACGDLDGDGVLDLALATTTGAGGALSVLLAGSIGGCGRKDFAAGNSASYVDAADFDADGRLDLAVTSENGLFMLRFGDGNGEFGPAQNYGIGTYAQAFAIADFDLDTRPDVVCPSFSTGQVSIYRNQGDGTLQLMANLPAGSRPRFAATADFNLDGYPDFVTSDYGDAINPGTLSVWLGRGDATFRPAVIYPCGVGAYEISIADLNGDQAPDLVVDEYDGQTVSVYLNRGDGVFPTRVPYPVGWNLSSALADLDHDGDRDLVTANFKEGTISILRNLGNGTFGPKTDIAVGPRPRSVVATVLNADGHTDLAVATSGSSTIALLRNDGTGQFTLSRTCQTGVEPKCLLAVDVDKNGGLDLLTANSGSGSASILSDVAPAWSSPSSIAAAKRPRKGGSREGAAVFALAPAFPNPVEATTLLRFSIPAAEHVDLRLYDVAGRVVQTLVDGDLPAGEHVVEWSAADAGRTRAAGLYFYRLRAGGREMTKSLIVR